MSDCEALFEVPKPAMDTAARAAKQGWPDGLLERALRVRVPPGDVDWWLDHETPVQEVAKAVSDREQMVLGTMRVRVATWEDDAELAAVYANAPERIADFEVTVERSPYAFAQFRLQENAYVHVLEDRGVLLGAFAHAVFQAVVGGQKTTVHFPSAVRVRKECRGKGYSRLLQGPGPGTAWFGYYNAYYVRPQNLGGMGWIRSILPEVQVASSDAQTEGTSVSVHALTAGHDADPTGIRPTRLGDAARCVSLINRTHRGRDLFRPYSSDFLRGRLDDPAWGPKPQWWTPVYGWGEHFVVERDGRVVACAGLWDRGRHLREVWTHTQTGERRVIESAAVLDFGYAEGHEEAMSTLIRYLASKSREAGREVLLAPLMHDPEVLNGLSDLAPAPESRGLILLEWHGDEEGWKQIPAVRPYTDLAYW